MANFNDDHVLLSQSDALASQRSSESESGPTPLQQDVPVPLTGVMAVLAGLGKVEHRLLRVTRTLECTVRTKPGVTMDWLKTALFSDGLRIVKSEVFDHDDDRVFEMQLRGPARQFDIARAELLDRSEVLNVMFD